MFNYLKNFLFVSFILMMPYMNLSLGAMMDEKTSITHKTAVKLGKPGPEEWKDSSGNPAPANVRRAADNAQKCWDQFSGSVWAYQYGNPNTTCCFCCSFPDMHSTSETKNPRALHDDETWYHGNNSSESIQAVTEKQFSDALDELKAAVNSNVKHPVPYERDIIFGFAFKMWTDGYYRLNISIEEGVMNMVNKLGGWEIKDALVEKPLVLKTKLVDGILHVNF